MADRKIGTGLSPLVSATASAGLVAATAVSPLEEADGDAGLEEATAASDRWLVGDAAFASWDFVRITVLGDERITADGELRVI